MNQILKEAVYSKGTEDQINVLADVGGMNQEERDMLHLMHENKDDQYIQDAMHVSRKSFEKIQVGMRTKLNIAIFRCVDFYMYNGYEGR